MRSKAGNPLRCGRSLKEVYAEEGILFHLGSAVPSPQDSAQPPSPPVTWGKQPRKGPGQSTHGKLVEQELGVSDVGQGWLWLGTHEHQVGEEPQEVELHPHSTWEGDRSARQLWKGNSSTINSLEGPVSTSLHSSVPEGQLPPLHTLHGSPWPCPQGSVAAPKGQMGSVRDRASFRVCLISITCFPVTRGSRPMSVGKSWKHKDHSRFLIDLPAFQAYRNVSMLLEGYSHGTWPVIWILGKNGGLAGMGWDDVEALSVRCLFSPLPLK